MENEQSSKIVYRAVYKDELNCYCSPEKLAAKPEYTTEYCEENYSGKNNLNYQQIKQNCGVPDCSSVIHFFENFDFAEKYAKALVTEKKSVFITPETSIIACEFSTDLLEKCKGYGIYEDNNGESLQIEYAVPLDCYDPSKNLLGVASSKTNAEGSQDIKISSISSAINEPVYYDPDVYY